MKDIGIDSFELVPAEIIVTVAGRFQHAGTGDAVFLHGPDDLQLVVFRDPVDLKEPLPEAFLRFICKSGDPVIHPKESVYVF